ncbi:MAG: FHA domain-containing protein [Anaerolineae bacterium]|nr:FHA domain-containing protein [Anaerolineae bacterium]
MSPYGRLEIYWPEGPVESFVLAKEAVAIGRQSGNDLVLDRKGVSRYHVTIRAENNQVVLEDLESVNGVYVDSLRMKPGERRVLRGGEEIQIADVRMVVRVFDSLEDTVPTEAADNIVDLENEYVMVHFTGPDMVAVPGADVKAALILENVSNDTQRYRIQIQGVPREWLRLDRTEIQLASGAQTEVVASFKPLRRSDTKPGHYPLSVTIETLDHSESDLHIESQLKVGAFGGFGMVMATEIIQGKEPFKLYVHNQGNAPLTVSFRGVDPTGSLNCAVSPRVVTLQGGERQTIEGRVTPLKGTLIGKAHEYKYDIIALSHDASSFQAAVPGRYLAKPLLPSWAATLAVPLVAIAAIGLVVLVAFLLGGGDEDNAENQVVPAILAFTASQSEVVLGEPVQLTWEVQDVRNVTITHVRPGQSPQTITVDDPSASAYQLLLQTTGRYDITLNVENTGGMQSEVLSVSVKPAIAEFSSNPTTLIQNVTQPVDFVWNVRGMAEVNGQPQIFLQSKELPDIEAVKPSGSGLSRYMIFPAGPVSVTLRVVGQDNTENSRTLAIAVVEPRCLLSNPEGKIYTGPNINYDSVGVFTDIGTVINPIVRNQENTWLQIVYEGQPAWVRIADFQCEGFRPEQLNVAANVPPTPTLLPTSTPTLTQTATTEPPTATRTRRPSSTPRPQTTPTPSGQ